MSDAVVNAALAMDNIAPDHFIPDTLNEYTPFGNHSKIYKIVASGKWCPTFVTGLSGCGKTTTIQQVCASLKRECVRVNITVETDEDDLLGGFRLVKSPDGNTSITQFVKGPVVMAMERGAILLLDEIDLASHKIMCIQPILEGNPIFLKKISHLVRPKKGFNAIATANTKGQGCETGKFIGTTVLNEAFLDRYTATLVQDYPNPETEKKILTKYLQKNGVSDPKFVECLVAWADKIRKLHAMGQEEEIISTRRLIQIVCLYTVCGDKVEAISDCTARFISETQKKFLDFYGAIDATVNVKGVAKVVTPDQQNEVEIDANKIPL